MSFFLQDLKSGIRNAVKRAFVRWAFHSVVIVSDFRKRWAPMTKLAGQGQEVL